MNKETPVELAAPTAEPEFRVGDEVEIRFRLKGPSSLTTSSGWLCAVLGEDAKETETLTGLLDSELRLGRWVERVLAVGDRVRDPQRDAGKVVFLTPEEALVEYAVLGGVSLETPMYLLQPLVDLVRL